jgi:hypothetical protein
LHILFSTATSYSTFYTFIADSSSDVLLSLISLILLFPHFQSASSLKEQSADRHVGSLGHIILILSHPVFALSPYIINTACLMEKQQENAHLALNNNHLFTHSNFGNKKKVLKENVLTSIKLKITTDTHIFATTSVMYNSLVSLWVEMSLQLYTLS